MENSNQNFSKTFRAFLMIMALSVLNLTVPSARIASFDLSSAENVRLKPPIAVVKPLKQIYASALHQLDGYKQIAETVITQTVAATKTWKIVKVETKKVDAAKVLWPVRGAITSKYGMRIHPVTGNRKFHNGIDIRGKKGTNVVCPTDGVVVDTGWQGALGRMVKVKTSSGHTLCFGHLSSIKCKTGQKLSRGQLLGKVGATGRVTGPHLHFSVIYKGDYMNPLKYLSTSK